MKTILILILFTKVLFCQNDLFFLMGDDRTPAQKLFDTYKARVVADGGAIINEASVQAFYDALLLNSYKDSLKAWYEADCGIKKTGVNISKVYDLIGTYDLVQTGADAVKPDYYADSLGGKPTWYFGNAAFFVNTSLTFAASGAYYLVYRTSVIDNDNPIGSSDAAGAYAYMLQRANGEVWERVYNGTTNINVGLGEGAVTANWTNYIFTGTWTVGYGSREINNGAIATATSAGVDPTSSNTIVLGGDNNGGSSLFLGHISAFGVGVNNSRAAWIKTYLNTKYTIY